LTYYGLWWKKIDDIIEVSKVFELFHTMALIHDDIIDKSDKRHNVPTIHEHINNTFPQKNIHIANWQAMLIWDLILNRVYNILYSQNNFQKDIFDKVKQLIHKTIEEVILWEMIDVDMTLLEPTTVEDIQKKNLYKTARYTFARPMLIGAILAWADQQTQDKIFSLWEELGLAFQVRDDLLDITDGDITKTQFSDVQEWQQTLFTQHILTKGKTEDKNFLKKCLWKKLSEVEITKLQQIFQESGAINRWKQKIEKHTKNAIKILDNNITPTPSKNSENFKTLLRLLIEKLST